MPHARSSRFLAALIAPITITCALIGGTLSAQGTQTLSLEPVADNTLYENGNGNTSNGAGDSVFAGATVRNGARRALLRFNVAAALPQGATIVTTALELTATAASAPRVPFTLHRVTADWGEGSSTGSGNGGPSTPGDATWVHTFFPNQTWGTAGGDFSPTPSSMLTLNGPRVWSFTGAGMDADVQSWANIPALNQGWLLKAVNENATGGEAYRFASREATSALSRPKLIVVYTLGAAASVTPVGSGCPNVNGGGGGVFTLSTIAGATPRLGSTTFGFELADGPPSLGVALYWSPVAANPPLPALPGCSIQLDPITALQLIQSGASPLLTGALDSNGDTTWPLPLPNAPVLAGYTLIVQAAGPDANSVSGLVVSNALGLTLGF